MTERRQLKRVDNPEGHQVCKVDEETRTVEIQNKKYMTVIHFLDGGGCAVQHQKVKEEQKKRAI